MLNLPDLPEIWDLLSNHSANNFARAYKVLKTHPRYSDLPNWDSCHHRDWADEYGRVWIVRLPGRKLCLGIAHHEPGSAKYNPVTLVLREIVQLLTMAKERQLSVMTAEVTLPTLNILSQIMHEINDPELQINQELEKAKVVVSILHAFLMMITY